MARPTLEPPPVAVSEGVKVGAQSLAVGVFGSHGGSTDRPAFLPWSISALGSGARYDARVRPSVSKECGSLLPMWRDGVRPLSVDAAAYENALLIGALSINTTVCGYIELDIVLGSALLRECEGYVVYLVPAIGSPFVTHIDGARVRNWFGEVKNSYPDIAFVTDVSPGALVDVAPGSYLQAGIAYGNYSIFESHTGAIRAKIVQNVVNGRALAFKRSSVSDIRNLRVSRLGIVEGRKLRIIHDLTFAGNAYRSSVNDDSDFSGAPSCELGHVFGDVCRRILYLRQRHGVVARVLVVPCRCQRHISPDSRRPPACC